LVTPGPIRLLGVSLVALAACTTSSNIRPSELERLDGFQARQAPQAERPLETIEGQSIAFGAQSKLFLDLPEQRVGGSFDSIQVREGVFEGRTADGRQVQTRVAQIRAASVEEPDRVTPIAIAGGVLAVVAAVFVVLVISTSSQSQAVPGRALRIRKRIVKAPLARADSWRATLPTVPDVDALSPDARAAIATGWTDAARGEHASVPAFSRLSLTLMAMGAPSDLVEAAHRAALDEIEHTKLAFALAAAYAGAEVAPGALEELMTAPAVTAGSLPDLAEESLVDGCLLEGIAAEAARAASARATDPVIRAALATIASDEAAHAELAWGVVTWCCEEGGVDLRGRLLTVIHRAALPAPPLDVPPALEAEMGDHGWLAPRAWRDVCERTQLAVASRLAVMVAETRRPPN
jgi:hypothetical protein